MCIFNFFLLRTGVSYNIFRRFSDPYVRVSGCVFRMILVIIITSAEISSIVCMKIQRNITIDIALSK